MSKTLHCEVLVLGAGPGGYTAAFRSADLGKKVILVDKEETLGGVCLNVGCIPSKALLHVAKVIDEAGYLSQHGVQFASPKVDTKQLREWKNQVIGKLTSGLSALAKQRQVEVVRGKAQFDSPNAVIVAGKENIKITFEYAIIATGSRPATLPFIPSHEKIMDSTTALELNQIKGKLLIIGGGIIGLEMATVYHALGTEIHIVELADQIMPGADRDVVAPLYQQLQKKYRTIMLETKVTKVEPKSTGIQVAFEGKAAPSSPQVFDQVLLAIGRIPNSNELAIEKAGLQTDERKFISVDKQLRTKVPHILAIGDVVGQPMLAHKAHAEAHIAAEVIAGKKHYFDPRCIPNVAYTDPEVAWTGLTEKQAETAGIPIGKGIFPWRASGRSLSMGREDGMTKVLFNKDNHRIIGAAVVGPNAGELIAELSLAIEMACDAEDIALTIHPHPTLSETIAFATESFLGTITDLYLPKKAKERA